MLEHHAERLGLDEATRAGIRTLAEASRPETEALEEQVHALREEMRGLLDQEQPDVDAVMRQADRIGAAEIELDKHRLRTLLAIRALLTPEQRRELVRIHEERMRERGFHRRPDGSPPPDAP